MQAANAPIVKPALPPQMLKEVRWPYAYADAVILADEFNRDVALDPREGDRITFGIKGWRTIAKHEKE